MRGGGSGKRKKNKTFSRAAPSTILLCSFFVYGDVGWRGNFILSWAFIVALSLINLLDVTTTDEMSFTKKNWLFLFFDDLILDSRSNLFLN